MEQIKKDTTDNLILKFAAFFNSLPGVVGIHDLRNFHVAFLSDNGLNLMNKTLQDIIDMGTDYHKIYFNEEDAKEYVPLILGMLEKNNNDDFVTFFQQIKPKPDGDFNLWFSGVKLFARDAEGKPVLTISISLPIDPEHNLCTKLERLMEDNRILRDNYTKLASLSKREKEVLKFAAIGKSNSEIADELNLSADTIKTHRKNINRKLQPQNPIDLIRLAQVFDLTE